MGVLQLQSYNISSDYKHIHFYKYTSKSELLTHRPACLDCAICDNKIEKNKIVDPSNPFQTTHDLLQPSRFYFFMNSQCSNSRPDPQDTIVENASS